MPQFKKKSVNSQKSSQFSGSKSLKDRSSTAKKNKSGGFQSSQSLFDEYEIKESAGYITQEFQDYGYRLAADLNDLEHKSLYIKLAKEENRGLLERARSFVIDSEARNKGALFMWKLKQLKESADAD